MLCSESTSDGLVASLDAALSPGAELAAEPTEELAAAGAAEGEAAIDANRTGQACFVCMDAAADAVLIECGHGGLCAGDTRSRRPCPPIRATPDHPKYLRTAHGNLSNLLRLFPPPTGGTAWRTGRKSGHAPEQRRVGESCGRGFIAPPMFHPPLSPSRSALRIRLSLSSPLLERAGALSPPSPRQRPPRNRPSPPPDIGTGGPGNAGLDPNPRSNLGRGNNSPPSPPSRAPSR